MTDPDSPDFRVPDTLEALIVEALPVPGIAAAMFAEALGDPIGYRIALENLSTPESVPTRDYAAEAAMLISAPNHRYGLPSVGSRAYGAPDVAYVGIFLGLEGTLRGEDYNDPELADAVMTLVWQPEAGTWLVHAVGARVLPENLPRYSPGVAPGV